MSRVNKGGAAAAGKSTKPNPKGVKGQRLARKKQLKYLRKAGVEGWTIEELQEDPYKMSRRILYDFLFVDDDDSGELSLKEVMKACKRVHGKRWNKTVEEECSKYFHDLDTNGNGELDMQEFAVLIAYWITVQVPAIALLPSDSVEAEYDTQAGDDDGAGGSGDFSFSEESGDMDF